MHRAVRSETVFSPNENISRTIAGAAGSVTPSYPQKSQPCGFVSDAGWRYGAGDPFCNAPAVRGSSYCARHHALCAIEPASADGIEAVREIERADEVTAAPPPDLAFLDAAPVAEIEPADEPADIALCLDLPPGETP